MPTIHQRAQNLLALAWTHEQLDELIGHDALVAAVRATAAENLPDLDMMNGLYDLRDRLADISVLEVAIGAVHLKGLTPTDELLAPFREQALNARAALWRLLYGPDARPCVTCSANPITPAEEISPVTWAGGWCDAHLVPDESDLVQTIDGVTQTTPSPGSAWAGPPRETLTVTHTTAPIRPREVVDFDVAVDLGSPAWNRAYEAMTGGGR